MRMMYLALAALVTLAACADTNGGYNTAGLDGGSGWNDTDISSEDLNDPASRGYFKNSVGDTVLFDVDEFTLNTAVQGCIGHSGGVARQQPRLCHCIGRPRG
jgi:peptidoglycan-associated lipoprotein